MGNASNAVWNSCYGQWSYLVSCTRQVVSFTLISILLLTLLLGAGWSTNNAFGVIGGPNRPNSSRPVTIRLMISQACKQLTANSPAKTSNGFHSVTTVLRQVEQLKPINEAPVQIQEMLDICDTEGNAQNGGGSFTIRDEGPRGIFVRFDTDEWERSWGDWESNPREQYTGVSTIPSTWRYRRTFWLLSSSA